MINLRTRAMLRVCALALLALLSSIALPSTSANAGCLPSSLVSKLNQIRAKFGPVKIISTHRAGARIAGTGRRSYHASCRAVDFHPPRGKYRQVAAWLKRNHSGGVGTYSCGMHHIHIDNGPRVRFHKCKGSSRHAKRSSKRRHASRHSRKSKKYAASRSARKHAGVKQRSSARYASAH